MTEQQAVEFVADDGSIIRACDFGPEFSADRRYLTLPDLEPIVPTEEPPVFVEEKWGLRLRLRCCEE